eukprot:CAMPEP_0183545678 /NCGR_PEP_ID=MMETSP0371-20130417/51759_1 /TAXON_ID=268820 /ORGANISM="Peridinium aciculiferum, Strain PAER-2" /LENGTH=180 /DNA_ID=CAMNT_0025747947 /DNA_START=197 /DNA_END=736 /DNA_ORIENTATION=+
MHTNVLAHTCICKLARQMRSAHFIHEHGFETKIEFHVTRSRAAERPLLSQSATANPSSQTTPATSIAQPVAEARALAPRVAATLRLGEVNIATSHAKAPLPTQRVAGHPLRVNSGDAMLPDPRADCCTRMQGASPTSVPCGEAVSLILIGMPSSAEGLLPTTLGELDTADPPDWPAAAAA